MPQDPQKKKQEPQKGGVTLHLDPDKFVQSLVDQQSPTHPANVANRDLSKTLGALFTGKYPQKGERTQKDKLSTAFQASSKEGLDTFIQALATEMEDAKTKRDDSLTNALEQSRTQELHDLEVQKGTVELGKAMQDLKSTKLQDDKDVLDMEVTKAKAVKDGLAIPPDNLEGFIARTMRETKWPSDGKAVEYMLTGQSGNVSQGIMDAVANQLKAQEESGKRSKQLDSAEKKFGDYLLQEMGNMLKKADEEKHLSMTPFGPAGGFLGGFLDIVTGPLDLGTEIFGGRMSAAQKVEMLGRVYAQTSPIVRAQMDDVLGKERMEMTHEHWLAKNGLGSIRPSVKNMEEANTAIGFSIDIRNDLAGAEGLQDSWGTDSTTGIQQAFSAYENVRKYFEDLQGTETPEETKAVAQKLIQADAAMREPIRAFLARGGTPKQIQEILRKTVDRINDNFQQPLQYTVEGSEAFKANAIKKTVAFDFTSKLADFETAILENIPLDIEANMKKRFGEKSAAKMKAGEGNIIKGATDKFKAALFAIEDDVKGKTWNPGRIRNLLKDNWIFFQGDEQEKVRKYILSKAPKERHERINKVFEDWKKELKDKTSLRGSINRLLGTYEENVNPVSTGKGWPFGPSWQGSK